MFAELVTGSLLLEVPYIHFYEHGGRTNLCGAKTTTTTTTTIIIIIIKSEL
jgi:hypothetical protein